MVWQFLCPHLYNGEDYPAPDHYRGIVEEVQEASYTGQLANGGTNHFTEIGRTHPEPVQPNTAQQFPQQTQMYQLQREGTLAGAEDPGYMSQERVMTYLQSQGMLSARAAGSTQRDAYQRYGTPDAAGTYPLMPPGLSEAEQAAMFRAMMGMSQQQLGRQQPTSANTFNSQDPGIWLGDAGVNGGGQQHYASSEAGRHRSPGVQSRDYDQNVPTTAPPAFSHLDLRRLSQDYQLYGNYRQDNDSEGQTPSTAPAYNLANEFSMAMQQQQQRQQQAMGNQFSNYRSPLLLPTAISPGPSPLLAPRQIGQVHTTDMGYELFEMQRAQAQAFAQAQLQAQIQYQQGQSAQYEANLGNNLAVEAMARMHHHHRNSSGASSYAGSVHSGLEGLEDQFLSATGLGKFGEITAEDYATSDFGGREASGLLDVEQFVDMDGGAGHSRSIASTGSDKASGGIDTLSIAPPTDNEPVFGVWTTTQNSQSPVQDEPLWQTQVDAEMNASPVSASGRSFGEGTMYADPLPLTSARGNSDFGNMHSQPHQQTHASQQIIPALDASGGVSEFGKRMNSMSSTRTPSTSSSLSITNHTIARTVSPLSGPSNGPLRTSPSRSGTLDSADGFPMPPFPPQGTSSPGTGGSRSNSPVHPIHQPRRVKTLSGPQVKPHSPPLLIIPDTSSPSPSINPVPLYPNRTNANPAESGKRQNSLSGFIHQPGQMTLGIPTGGNAGGPTAGGSFLSPIGPGGPSINIVPSTPTSGLREARGIWEKLAIQAQHDQRARTQQQGENNSGTSNATIPAPQGSVRRASHAGIYVPLTIDEGVAMGNGVKNATLPSQAQGTGPEDFRAPTLVTPPFRQRTRSEGAIHAMISDFGLSNTRQQSLEHRQSDESIDPRMLMGASGMSSRSSTPGFAVDAAGGPGVVYMGPNGLPVFVPTQGVIPGPEVFGANFILTNDGRRLSFDSRLERASVLLGSDASNPDLMWDQVPRNIKQEDFDNLLTSMVANGDERVRLGVGMPRQHSRQVKSEDWGRPAHMVDPQSQQLLIPEPQSTSRRGSLTSNGSGSRGNSPSRPRASSPYSRPPINDTVPYPKQSEHVSPAKSNLSLQDSGSEASGTSARRGRGMRTSDSGRGGANKIPRAKVTTPATEMASRGRRTSDGLFECPVPGCDSTFTRQFNLKGHIRSHNEERPYKCTFEGCDKSFARQHDCKRHMQLHIGIKPFICENCHRTFARLDALSRHHKTDSGAECAMRHPLPTNPDGTLMSESKYRAEMERRKKALQAQSPALTTVSEGSRAQVKMEE
ncbi:hypothetical protein QFC21_003317 [Naganishia friedmannii]|uniref:Uncharacterized protein n=1 Tax=Naganishia friedmannii TaxID=89922 RepID=A0ACC2VQ08_9TREE|nr:hypothetical protein QFC21_003317 [Naganishia friedmannii]